MLSETSKREPRRRIADSGFGAKPRGLNKERYSPPRHAARAVHIVTFYRRFLGRKARDPLYDSQDRH